MPIAMLKQPIGKFSPFCMLLLAHFLNALACNVMPSCQLYKAVLPHARDPPADCYPVGSVLYINSIQCKLQFAFALKQRSLPWPVL